MNRLIKHAPDNKLCQRFVGWCPYRDDFVKVYQCILRDNHWTGHFYCLSAALWTFCFPFFLYFLDKIDVFSFCVGRALSLYDSIPGCFPFLACSYISVIFTKYVEYDISGNIPNGSFVFSP